MPPGRVIATTTCTIAVDGGSVDGEAEADGDTLVDKLIEAVTDTDAATDTEIDSEVVTDALNDGDAAKDAVVDIVTELAALVEVDGMALAVCEDDGNALTDGDGDAEDVELVVALLDEVDEATTEADTEGEAYTLVDTLTVLLADGDTDALADALADEELDMHEVEPPSPQTYVGAETGTETMKKAGFACPVATARAIWTEEKSDAPRTGMAALTDAKLAVGGTYRDTVNVARLARRRPP